MMQPKRGIIHRAVQIRRVAAHRVVARCVQPEKAVRVAALDFCPEEAVGLRARADGDVEQIGGCEPFLRDVGGYVAAETARVVVGGVEGEVGEALHSGRDGADVCLCTLIDVSFCIWRIVGGDVR